MTALLAFALMFAPVAEAAVCTDEAPASATHQMVADIPTASDAHGDPAADLGDDLGLCQHGHCHHAAPCLPTLATALADRPTASTRTVKLENQHPRSRAAARLERPPRA